MTHDELAITFRTPRGTKREVLLFISDKGINVPATGEITPATARRLGETLIYLAGDLEARQEETP